MSTLLVFILAVLAVFRFCFFSPLPLSPPQSPLPPFSNLLSFYHFRFRVPIKHFHSQNFHIYFLFATSFIPYSFYILTPTIFGYSFVFPVLLPRPLPHFDSQQLQLFFSIQSRPRLRIKEKKIVNVRASVLLEYKAKLYTNNKEQKSAAK